MKKIITVLMLLVILIGCGYEPAGGGQGYQYLGASKQIIVICDEHNHYTTTVITGSRSIIVEGEIVTGGRWFFVWLNTEKRKLRLRRHELIAEYYVLKCYDYERRN